MTPSPEPFNVAFVAGVTLGKWSRIWQQRMRGIPLQTILVADAEQAEVLHDGRAAMSFIRLPVDRERLNVIPLYLETPVVIAPADHAVTAYDEVALADLTDEELLTNGRPRELVEQVALGLGLAIVPKSVARLYDRSDLAHRPVTDAEESQVGLAWLADNADERIETFIGIVRGRTERSSRTSGADRKHG